VTAFEGWRTFVLWCASAVAASLTAELSSISRCTYRAHIAFERIEKLKLLLESIIAVTQNR
jgi:hypothetical protein